MFPKTALKPGDWFSIYYQQFKQIIYSLGLFPPFYSKFSTFLFIIGLRFALSLKRLNNHSVLLGRKFCSENSGLVTSPSALGLQQKKGVPFEEYK